MGVGRRGSAGAGAGAGASVRAGGGGGGGASYHLGSADILNQMLAGVEPNTNQTLNQSLNSEPSRRRSSHMSVLSRTGSTSSLLDGLSPSPSNSRRGSVASRRDSSNSRRGSTESLDPFDWVMNDFNGTAVEETGYYDFEASKRSSITGGVGASAFSEGRVAAAGSGVGCGGGGMTISPPRAGRSGSVENMFNLLEKTQPRAYTSRSMENFLGMDEVFSGGNRTEK